MVNSSLNIQVLWKGVDKVTRLSVINEYEKGGGGGVKNDGFGMSDQILKVSLVEKELLA